METNSCLKRQFSNEGQFSHSSLICGINDLAKDECGLTSGFRLNKPVVIKALPV